MYFKNKLDVDVITHVGIASNHIKKRIGKANLYSNSLEKSLNSVLGINSPKIRTTMVIISVTISNNPIVHSPNLGAKIGSINWAANMVSSTNAMLLPTSMLLKNSLGLS